MHRVKENTKKVKPKWASDKHTLSTVKNLKSLGLTNEEMATIFGFKARQLGRLQENHPEFKQALVEGKANLHDRLVAKLVVAATGYDYDETRVKKDSKKKIVETITTTRHQPPSASLLIFLMTNQWGNPTERWKGWKVQRDTLPSKSLVIKIDGKAESDKICKLAGKLFGETGNGKEGAGQNLETEQPAPRKRIPSKEIPAQQGLRERKEEKMVQGQQGKGTSSGLEMQTEKTI